MPQNPALTAIQHMDTGYVHVITPVTDRWQYLTPLLRRTAQNLREWAAVCPLHVRDFQDRHYFQDQSYCDLLQQLVDHGVIEVTAVDPDDAVPLVGAAGPVRFVITMFDR